LKNAVSKADGMLNVLKSYGFNLKELAKLAAAAEVALDKEVEPLPLLGARIVVTPPEEFVVELLAEEMTAMGLEDLLEASLFIMLCW
jgi:hypothetical protein